MILHPKIRPKTRCRLCKSKNLSQILSLGNQGLSDFIDLKSIEKVARYPLKLVLCKNCNLLQMRYSTPVEELYTVRYGYRSGINQTMKNELKDIIDQIEKITGLRDRDVVVDIGCNDGTLLSFYKNRELIRVGFDPVTSFVKYFKKNLREAGISRYKLFSEFFHSQPFLKHFKNKKAKVITAISMFYDLDDPNTFLKHIKDILDPNGLLIIQQNYLVWMISQCAFDNIVHEHLTYYSLESLENLLNKNGFEVFDVFETKINGGSFRTLIKMKSSKIGTAAGIERIIKMRDSEKKLLLHRKQTYLNFAKRVSYIKRTLKKFIESEVKRGKTVYVYGASTRGNVLLQACGLNSKLIKAAAERNVDKWGKKIASTGIPIISEEQARKDHPDYFLVLPWSFRQEFLDREKEYLISGGKMIFPLPRLEIFSLNNGKVEAALLGGEKY